MAKMTLKEGSKSIYTIDFDDFENDVSRTWAENNEIIARPVHKELTVVIAEENLQNAPGLTLSLLDGLPEDFKPGSSEYSLQMKNRSVSFSPDYKQHLDALQSNHLNENNLVSRIIKAIADALRSNGRITITSPKKD